MGSDDWYGIDDLGVFLSRAGDFLRSRPALHTLALTVTEQLRTAFTVSSVDVSCLTTDASCSTRRIRNGSRRSDRELSLGVLSVFDLSMKLPQGTR